MLNAASQLFGSNFMEQHARSKRKEPYALPQNLTRLSGGGTPSKIKTPLASLRNARRVGGYTPWFRSQPPQVAYIDNQADTWFLPAAMTQGRTQPARGTEVFLRDPTKIHKNYKKNAKYFENKALQMINIWKTTPEKTYLGPGLHGKWYNPPGKMITLINGPLTNEEMPLYRGY